LERLLQMGDRALNYLRGVSDYAEQFDVAHVGSLHIADSRR
jgi:hypothetical protein